MGQGGNTASVVPLGASLTRPSRLPMSTASLDERLARIHDVLARRALTMVFQPVVELRTGRVTGAEALARFTPEPRRTPDVWFGEAWSVGLGVDLEIMAVRAALAELANLPTEIALSVNV